MHKKILVTLTSCFILSVLTTSCTNDGETPLCRAYLAYNDAVGAAENKNELYDALVKLGPVVNQAAEDEPAKWETVNKQIQTTLNKSNPSSDEILLSVSGLETSCEFHSNE